jgi:hypothetical protein|tara:strand:+ start:3501 stop:3680 length:180 start_codon:yes stop_codon:yes gene_type:complete
MAGQKPDFRAVSKIGEKLWTNIGAAWIKDKGNVSISLDFTPAPNSGKYSFLLVPYNGKE